MLFFLVMHSLHSRHEAVAQIRNSDAWPYAPIAESIIDSALAHGRAYALLRSLTMQLGARLSGSPRAAAAVEWARQAMQSAGLENVRLQEVMVPRWVRGEIEEARLVAGSTPFADQGLSICALGGSIATPAAGIAAEVLEVHSFAELCDKREEPESKHGMRRKIYQERQWCSLHVLEAQYDEIGVGGAGPAFAVPVAIQGHL